MGQEQKEGTKVSSGDVVGLISLVANSHVAAVAPFLRRGFGSEAFHPYAPIAFFVMLAMTRGRWANGMGAYLVAWAVALLCRRVETFRNWNRGVVVHSRFLGQPWLATKFWFVKTPEQARTFEPVLCVLLGGVLCLVRPTVGLFVMAGFASIVASACVEKLVVFQHTRQMRDAQIEGEFYAEEFRRGRSR